MAFNAKYRYGIGSFPRDLKCGREIFIKIQLKSRQYLPMNGW